MSRVRPFTRAGLELALALAAAALLLAGLFIRLAILAERAAGRQQAPQEITQAEKLR